ncbi:MAG TPA: N-acetylmuramoyl-L-alanine amidase [Allosphingosinicella sp.]|nr:N-acetylmuramoyl-L-alanine amidase [Allosphingosinicella sp.]
MADPKGFILELDPVKRPKLQTLPERVVADIAWYNANRASTRRFHPVKGIEGAVIHATAGGTSAGALSWWKDPRGDPASAHWIVPAEIEAEHGKSVIAAVYEALAAWHVRNDKFNPKVNGGKKLINHWSLGIEIVNTQKAGDTYSDWQVATTALLVRYCWAKYPNFKWVCSHAAVDPARRSDPGTAFPWDKFVALVLADSGDAGLEIDAVAAGARDGVPCGGC